MRGFFGNISTPIGLREELSRPRSPMRNVAGTAPCAPRLFIPEAYKPRVGSNEGHASLNVQYPCVVVGCHLRRKAFEFAVSHEPHKQRASSRPQ